MTAVTSEADRLEQALEAQTRELALQLYLLRALGISSRSLPEKAQLAMTQALERLLDASVDQDQIDFSHMWTAWERDDLLLMELLCAKLLARRAYTRALRALQDLGDS